MLLIGLGNKARQGKNFVANYMKEENNAIRLYAFADELKLYCKEHHEELVPQWQLANQTKQYPVSKDDPIYGYTPILQWYGTDVARKQDPDTWVKALDRRLSHESPSLAIITDVRFPNEAQYIKEKGGYLVQVIRLNADGSQYLDKGRDPNHPSEIALDDYADWDFMIEVVDGDLAGLKRKSIGVLNLVQDEELMEFYKKEIAWSALEAAADAISPVSSFVDEPEFDLDSDGTGFKF